jgi:carbamoyltransferase
MLDNSPFTRVFVQPASYDSGCAVGCCYFVHHDLLGFPRKRQLADPRLGPGFDNSSIEKALKRMGIAFEKSDHPEADCALAISQGKIVGWFQGRMEFGPRALGARSILADPRGRGMKRRVNSVKKRESFRPFAPSVLEERAAEYFETNVASPYMLFVRNVREEKKREIPSVTHVDGTARLQTVSRESNPGFHGLIAEFACATGVPVVLNTSLNLRGEPIACTPEDAVGVFARSKLDALFLGNYVVKKA